METKTARVRALNDELRRNPSYHHALMMPVLQRHGRSASFNLIEASLQGAQDPQNLAGPL